MAYYIIYPKSKVAKVKVVTKRPGQAYTRPGSRWGFAEGPLSSQSDVVHRLNQMGVSVDR